MEYSASHVLISLQNALENPNITRVVDVCATQKGAFVKDHLPDGTPCWRLPTQEEINDFNKEKTKDEV